MADTKYEISCSCLKTTSGHGHFHWGLVDCKEADVCKCWIRQYNKRRDTSWPPLPLTTDNCYRVWYLVPNIVYNIWPVIYWTAKETSYEYNNQNGRLHTGCFENHSSRIPSPYRIFRQSWFRMMSDYYFPKTIHVKLLLSYVDDLKSRRFFRCSVYMALLEGIHIIIVLISCT